MNSGRFLRGASILLVGILLSSPGFAQAQTKSIRLRNETIQTGGPVQTALAPATNTLSGLFLIQFRDHPAPRERAQLTALGVELLRFVPDDAFIARLNKIQPDQIRALSFVNWVGEYLPQNKIQGRLLQPVPAASGALSQVNHPVEVSILTRPNPSRYDLADIRRFVFLVRQESHLRQGTVLRGTINSANLNALAQSPAVLWIEPAPQMKLVDEVSSKIVGGDDGVSGTFTTTQQLGFTGAGVAVAVADTGLNNGDAATMHPDLFGRVTTFLFYGALTDAADEHSHGTHVTGIVAGNAATGETDDNGAFYGLGVAPQAQIVVQRIFDGAGNFEAPPSNETLTHDAVRHGAKIGSNSWGDDVQGRYDISAAEFDELVRDADANTAGDQPYILEFSAGNAGPGAQTIDTPAVAKNVIATGASENNRTDFFIYTDGQEGMADFSSRGPCEDGRIKPDVVAPGTWISSLQSASAGFDNAWAAIDSFYEYQGGTSQAGPHVSGAAAVFVQYYQSLHTNAVPSPALVKAALINSAVDMDDTFGTGPIPNMDEGWGRIDLTGIIGSTRGYEYVDQTTLLTSGQVFEHHTFVRSAQTPLKITMDYTDVPGFPGAIPALVNDLDLEVIGPDGTMYRGNQFIAGESVPNAPSADNINNVEAVHIAQPLPGDYLIRVRARNVVEDARTETGAIDQDFALVISGDIPPPGQGLILLDRSAYTVPGVINVQVVDSDQAGKPSVSVLLQSTTEEAGENISLTASGPSGVFTNSIATATGAPVHDGILQIHNGDAITARYLDASARIARTASAVADFVPPVITAVTVTNQFNQMLITWQTDEPSTSIVRYGTNPANLALTSTNLTLTTSHSATINNFVTGTTYRFLVISADAAGNTATNNNGGALYTFIGAQKSTVLLVDAYVSDADSQTIPVSSYTDALAASGITFNVWDMNVIGSPQAADLGAFPVVIWRVSDSIYTSSPNSTLSSAQQSAIQTYLNGGGSFFMSSMEILSRLGDVAFRSNVFQVAGFITNPDPLSTCTDCDEDVGVPSIQGVGNDPVSSGINVTLDYSSYPTIDVLGLGPDFSDTFTPGTNAAAIIHNPASGKVAGMRYPRTGLDSKGRVVFLSFPIDTVPTSGTNPNNRASFLKNIISFLVPGVNGLGTISLDAPSYPVPGLLTVEVGDSDLAGQGHATVTLTSDSATNGISVLLNETVRPGLFRGFVTLVPTNAVTSTNQLRAKNGDTIVARYFDASANSTVQVAAAVDTQPPVISGVTADPGYQNSTVTWTTSEPSDSLVQFGESPLLGRTGYDPALTTDHSVTLQGLSPNRTYYYQVVSRDQAGNTATDDNHNNLYAFQTLIPIVAPWSDNMETGATNWTVQDADGTQLSWTLGVPNNGNETNAHSPTMAWGSNLNGQPSDSVESFLISPAIQLPAGNQATLQFWHSYDFTERTASDIEEFGEVMIITNSISSPVSLVQYTDLSAGWQQESIDLTPYAGQVVYLVWHYLQFSIDSAPRPGWLVDDVSVTVTNTGSGTIQISNNLAQAHFSLSGPLSQSGQGLATVLSNAPPGQYVIQFANVPYYQTPAPQTNTLAASGILIFQGNYTFVDANHNGISDAWEQQYFNSVSTNRTQTTDTDGDGMSDYAEFIAGTDPTNAASKFNFLRPVVQPNAAVLLQWSSVPGRVYQVQSATNLNNWSAITGWLPAVDATNSYSVTNVTSPTFFRVQVRP